MITGFRIRNTANPAAGTLTLPLRDGGSGLQILQVDGLTPVNTHVISQDRALRPGSDVLGARPQTRNIVFTIGYSPNYVDGRNIYDLRDHLYSWFNAGSHVVIEVTREGYQDVKTEGYVETLEANIFGSDPLVQISLYCPESYFEAIEPEVSTLDIEPGFAYVHTTTSQYPIPYGFKVVVSDVIPDMNRSWYIRRMSGDFPEEEFRFDLTGSNATSFEYSTVRGDRYLEVTDQDGSRSRPDLIQPSSPWPLIMPGTTKIRIAPVGGGAAFSVKMSRVRLFGGL